MNTDAAEPQPQGESPDLWRLPEVLEVRVGLRRFEPPRRVTTKGVDREVRSAVEIEIQVSEPFQIRALAPVLWVGDVPLTMSESDGKNTYRFFALEAKTLIADAPISLSWSSTNAPRMETRYGYTPPSS